MNARAAAWLAGAALAVVAFGFAPLRTQSNQTGLGLAPIAAHAQDDLDLRTVSGFVLDDDSKGISGATVFLKNLKTKTIRSFASLNDGSFQFAGCNMSIDYELWAEKGGEKSTVKTVSTWDTRKQWSGNLRLK